MYGKFQGEFPVFQFIDSSCNDKITKCKQRNYMEIKCKTKQQNSADDDDDDDDDDDYIGGICLVSFIKIL